MLQVFCLLLVVNFASAERGRDGERLTKSHGTRTRSRDSTGAWGAWSSTSKRDSRGITEEEVILQELKELILEEDIGEVRRHESRIGRRGNRGGDGHRERGGRQVGDVGQFGEGRLGTGVKFERQVEIEDIWVSVILCLIRVLMAVNFVAKQVGLRLGREMSARKNLKQSAKPSKYILTKRDNYLILSL